MNVRASALCPRGQRLRAYSLQRRRLRLLEDVVVERLHEDRRVNRADDVLAGVIAGGIDHGLHPAPCSDDTGGDLVALAVQVGSSERPECIVSVEPDLVVKCEGRVGGK